jgi:hypothetical protein
MPQPLRCSAQVDLDVSIARVLSPAEHTERGDVGHAEHEELGNVESGTVASEGWVSVRLGEDGPTWALLVADVLGWYETDRFRGVPRDVIDDVYPRTGAFAYASILRVELEYEAGSGLRTTAHELPLARRSGLWTVHYEPLHVEGPVAAARVSVIADGVNATALRIRNVAIFALPGASTTAGRMPLPARALPSPKGPNLLALVLALVTLGTAVVCAGCILPLAFVYRHRLDSAARACVAGWRNSAPRQQSVIAGTRFHADASFAAARTSASARAVCQPCATFILDRVCIPLCPCLRNTCNSLRDAIAGKAERRHL